MAALTPEQPGHGRACVDRAEHAVRRQRLDRLAREPAGQIGVDRPTAVGSDRVAQEAQPLVDNGMVGPASGGQAHHHEAGQRDGLEEPPAGRLDPGESAQCGSRRQVAQPSHHRHAVRMPLVQQLPDRHQGRQRVADHPKRHQAHHGMRQTREFERQGRDVMPVGQVGQGQVGEDRHGKRSVLTVQLGHGAGPLLVRQADVSGQVGVGPVDHVVRASGQRGRSAHQQRGRHVAGAVGGIAPGAVAVLGAPEPTQAACHQVPVAGPVRDRQRADRCGTRQRRAGQCPMPPPAGPALVQQRAQRHVVRLVHPVVVAVRHDGINLLERAMNSMCHSQMLPRPRICRARRRPTSTPPRVCVSQIMRGTHLKLCR